jgi:hypothetical protein
MGIMGIVTAIGSGAVAVEKHDTLSQMIRRWTNKGN